MEKWMINTLGKYCLCWRYIKFV